MSRLLIISCSEKKNKTDRKLPAIERYTGVSYSVINKLKREDRFPEDVQIAIISAKYGLLRPDTKVENYDMAMTEQQARILNRSILEAFEAFLINKSFEEIFINLGKYYMISFRGFEKYIHPKTKIIIAKGGLGEKTSEMKRWLETGH